MFLTDAELKELTGYERRADQRRWLTERGWAFETSAQGRPSVSRAYAERRHGVASAEVVTAWQPNLAALGR